ncbi:hypothetical protein SAMN06295974_3870 [Plantibacter flavus]|uniref:Uncharacterized protein n=1 Tax=Plantibacter flavus TaxID=150123 RepID=A0A3N2BL43_9MICO|nr:hypothetical protein [Plantibacter flavus]ROR75985.1 hypothetical protein EDD42_3936 [Plantibacter flavus]SMG49607.1 hypothetical protein SAMN06295974_3870 [Plantibacter flavus]
MPDHSLQTQILTRRQYMHDRVVSHEDYYRQFVTADTIRVVDQVFSLERLTAALENDRNLNSIPLADWDAATFVELRAWPGDTRFRATLPFNRSVAAGAGESITRATITCIAKCAAKLLVLQRHTHLAPA